VAVKSSTIKLHETLIRMAKGMLTAWEAWLKEQIQKP
jgi:hypothetical protein